MNTSKNSNDSKKKVTGSVVIFALIVLNSYLQGRISPSPLGVCLTVLVAIMLGSCMFKVIMRTNDDHNQNK